MNRVQKLTNQDRGGLRGVNRLRRWQLGLCQSGHKIKRKSILDEVLDEGTAESDQRNPCHNGNEGYPSGVQGKPKRRNVTENDQTGKV